jgi:hypothetical protein
MPPPLESHTVMGRDGPFGYCCERIERVGAYHCQIKSGWCRCGDHRVPSLRMSAHSAVTVGDCTRSKSGEWGRGITAKFARAARGSSHVEFWTEHFATDGYHSEIALLPPPSLPSDRRAEESPHLSFLSLSLSLSLSLVRVPNFNGRR